MLDLSAIEARIEKATRGPWSKDALHDLLRFGRKHDGPWNDYGPYGLDIHENDAEFIVHAREDVPMLIVEILYLQNRLNEINAPSPETGW